VNAGNDEQVIRSTLDEVADVVRAAAELRF